MRMSILLFWVLDILDSLFLVCGCWQTVVLAFAFNGFMCVALIYIQTLYHS